VSAAATDRGAEIAELIDRHYNALAGGIRKDSDCHWWISERWTYGRHAGWVIEHDGYCYDGLEHGEDGPFPTRVEAEVVLIEHLLAAIAEVEARED
jgi:hypothetical protein